MNDLLVFPDSLASVQQHGVHVLDLSSAVACLLSVHHSQQHVVYVVDLSSAVACLLFAHLSHQHIAHAVGVAAVVELRLFAEQYALHAAPYHELNACSIAAPFPQQFQQLGELYRVFSFSIVAPPSWRPDP